MGFIEEQPITTTLPYEFDTLSVWEKTLKVGTWFLIGLALLVVTSLLTGKYMAALQLSLIVCVLLFLGRKVLNFYNGSAGTITRDRVEVRAGHWFGRMLAGPSGSYPIQDFKSIRVQHVAGSTHPDIQSSAHLVVYLVGRDGTPTIQIANVDEKSRLGEELASLLQLPCEKVNNWSRGAS